MKDQGEMSINANSLNSIVCWCLTRTVPRDDIAVHVQ